jgi:class 3 adenylate cyclase
MPKTAADCLALVQRYEREGELFRAYDLARQGLKKFPTDLALKHRAVLCLASTGATRQSAELFDRLGLERAEKVSLATQLGLNIATLRPRLMKDTALATIGRDRKGLLAAATEAYSKVYRGAKEAANPEAYYPGVNAATLSLLAGDEAAATRLAWDVLNQLSAFPRDKKHYYEIASELEARLILGDVARAHVLVPSLKEETHRQKKIDYRGLSGTLRQLRLVVQAKNLAAEWQDILAPPRILHYLGHIIAAPGVPGRFPAEQEPIIKKAIAKMLATEEVGFGYGSLAAGADILFAEALLARGASLHVVLPFNLKEFVEISVRPAGARWVQRFNKCLRAAKKNGTVRFATEDQYLGDDDLFTYSGQLAMGLALLRARHMSATAEQIVVWDGNSPIGPAGTAVDMANWQHSGMPQRVIPVGNGYRPTNDRSVSRRDFERRPCAMLFGDMHGFSRLRDEQLPGFITLILGCFAQVIDRNREHILLANTWGDGLFLVFDDAGRAAGCALELQEAVSQIDLSGNGLSTEMALRIGVHLGPVYKARDPVLKKDNFFGAHVSRAARIEPVTPEGSVYVTETLAAVLALHNSEAFISDYVGMTKAAKHYGTMRMFLLRRRTT